MHPKSIMEERFDKLVRGEGSINWPTRHQIGSRRRFFPEFGYNSRMLGGGDADSDVIRNFKQTIIHQDQIFCHQVLFIYY